MVEERARAAALVLASAAPLEQQRQRESTMSGDEAFMRRGQLGGGRQAAGKQSGSRVGEEDESDLEAAGGETLEAKFLSIEKIVLLLFFVLGGRGKGEVEGWV